MMYKTVKEQIFEIPIEGKVEKIRKDGRIQRVIVSYFFSKEEACKLVEKLGYKIDKFIDRDDTELLSYAFLQFDKCYSKYNAKYETIYSSVLPIVRLVIEY